MFPKAVDGWNLFAMSDPNYNEQTNRRYLLGELPEVETERLDELSITDDKFAATLSVAEKELVDSYVQGELSEEDLARFKSHYLASPRGRDRVDFARALQVFGERSVGASVAGVQTELSTTRKTGWFSTLFINSRPIVQWGFAVAALVLLIAGGLLLFQNIRLRQQINQTQARRDELQQREVELQKQLENQRTANATAEQELARVREERARLEEQLRSGKAQPSPGEAIASLILTPQMRGAGQIKTVSLNRDTQRVAIKLELEPNEYSTYSVALIGPNGGEVWRSGKLRPSRVGDRKSLSLSIRATVLSAGTHRMRLSGVAADGTAEVISEYPFRVSK